MEKRVWGKPAAWCLVVGLFVSGCSSAIQLKPTTPGAAVVARQLGVALVSVGIAPDMPADRVELLLATEAAGQLQQAVLASFANAGAVKAGGITLTAQIHVYRISNWGPSRMGVQVNLTDGAGNVIKSFETQTASARGGSTTVRTQRLAQDLVQKIVDAT